MKRSARGSGAATQEDIDDEGRGATREDEERWQRTPCEETMDKGQERPQTMMIVEEEQGRCAATKVVNCHPEAMMDGRDLLAVMLREVQPQQRTSHYQATTTETQVGRQMAEEKRHITRKPEKCQEPIATNEEPIATNSS